MSNAWKYLLCYMVLFLFGVLWLSSVMLVGELAMTWFLEPSQRAVVVLGYISASVFAAVGSAVIVPRLGSSRKGS